MISLCDLHLEHEERALTVGSGTCVDEEVIERDTEGMVEWGGWKLRRSLLMAFCEDGRDAEGVFPDFTRGP